MTLPALNCSYSPISPGDLIRLRSGVGLSSFSREAAGLSLRNTLYSVAFYENSEFVAYGRILGDGVLFFYIQDVIVLPDWQNQGFGRRIMEQLLHWIQKNAASNASVRLMCPHSKQAFYEKFGFNPRSDPEYDTTMIWKVP